VTVVEYYALRYENGKMRPVETVPGMGRGDKGEWWRGEFNSDYCKNFGKCHNVAPVQQ
jgi:hypothetical protein